MLVFNAVLPLPNRSKEMPSRGEMSFQFCTRPVQLFGRLFKPSGQASYVWAGLRVLAGSVSGSVAPWNQSNLRPALIVARLIVHRS